jgi:adenylate kinase
MRLILVGPNNSGKGTQAKFLRERLGLAHISTGDILREARSLGSPAGKQAASFMDAGQLVPDALVNELVADVFRRENRPENFVLDGYPRTLAQAAALDPVLRQQFLNPIEHVIVLHVPDHELVRRAKGRWVCPKDQTPYNIDSKPPKQSGLCDLCQTPLIQRADDQEETVCNRLKVYHESTEAMLDFYRNGGLVRDISGEGDMETVYGRIKKALGLSS